ncbi:MAG: hypothetical protein KZQ93_18930 [Candidatus Thiodiazotropha sp. (ex Monitilora ramsayi)]|nr:hypothetical protein [Candidatus Thiodiazotropha sp. (ex Monitilora ramsayi)]
MQKIMISPVHIWSFCLLIIVFAIDSNAQLSDDIVFYPTELDVLVNFDGTNRRNSNDSRETEWEAGLRIGQAGYVLDPKIAWFLIDVEPVYTWSEFDSDQLNQENDGELLNYLFQTNLLRGTPGPFGFDLTSQRTSNLNTGSLGSRFDTVVETNSASINWKNNAFPTSLKYEERTFDEEFRSSLNSAITERDEFLKSWILKGRSSKLNVHFQHDTLDDRIVTRDQDYELDKGLISHSLKWGRNSQLFSLVDYNDRTGFNANERLTIKETARIQHLDNIYSRTSYHYQNVTTAIESEEHGGSFELNHRLHRNLDTTVFVNSSSLESDNADEDKWRAGLKTQYHKNNLFGANIWAGIGASYRETDRDSKLGLVDIIDESHVVSLSGIVTLNQRFIVTSTIIVTDSTGTIVYDEGVDYIVVSAAGDRTQLNIIPGGRIDTGDTILVSYSAEQLPTQEFSTTHTHYNLTIDYNWFRLTHTDSKSDDKLISGASESFLQDTRNTHSDIEFKSKLGRIDALFGAERRFTLYGGFESTVYTLRQNFSWKSSGNGGSRNGILWNLSATQSTTEQETQDTDLYRIDLSANWKPGPNLTIRPILSAWKRTDEGVNVTGGRRDDEFFTVGLWARWRYRQVDLDLNYHHDERTVERPITNGTTETIDDRLMFTLRRRIM